MTSVKSSAQKEGEDMKKVLIATLGVAALCIAASCSSMRSKSTALMQAQCFIETEAPDTLVELTLDGKLIFSGKTRQEKSGNIERCDFAASPGDHRLVVSAGSHETWDKQVTIVGGSNRFWAKLKREQ
jgi:hypothetical protein